MNYQVTLTKHEIRLIHRIMSSGIIAAPKEVRDGLRNKMADVTKQIAQLGSETIDGQANHSRGTEEDSDLRSKNGPVLLGRLGSTRWKAVQAKG